MKNFLIGLLMGALFVGAVWFGISRGITIDDSLAQCRDKIFNNYPTYSENFKISPVFKEEGDYDNPEPVTRKKYKAEEVLDEIVAKLGEIRD